MSQSEHIAKEEMYMQKDPLLKALFEERGLISSIRFCCIHKYIPAAIIMSFVTIDSISNLGRATDKDENDSNDFKSWCKKYLNICKTTILSPDDLWAARCSLIHTYGSESKDTRKRKAKIIAWVDNNNEPVKHKDNLIVVSFHHFKQSLYDGICKFFDDIYAGKHNITQEVFEKRLDKLVNQYNLNK